MKCTTCGKIIQNAHYLNGKAYGYNCYKVVLAQYKLEKQQLLNDEYAQTVFMTIQVYQTMTFTKSYSKDFQDSILKQYNECGKLTYKQLQAVQSKFKSNEWLQYDLLKFDLMDDEIIYVAKSRKNRCKVDLGKRIEEYFYKFNREKFDINLLDDEAFINVLNYIYQNGWYTSKDIEDDFIFIKDIKEIEKDTEDEYIEILKVCKAV